MAFFNRINLTFIKRTNLLSRISCSKVCARGSKVGKTQNAAMNAALQKTANTAVLKTNAFGPIKNNLNPGISANRGIQTQQAFSNLPSFLKLIPINQSSVKQVHVTTSNANQQSSSTINKTTLNNSINPKANFGYNSYFKIDFRSPINPKGIFCDNNNPLFCEVLPIAGRSMEYKIFLGCRILDYFGNPTGLSFGYLYSTKEYYTNCFGLKDRNEKISDTITIKDNPGIQYKSTALIFQDSHLKFYSGTLNKDLAYDGLKDFNYYCTAYNTLLNTNPGTVELTLSGKTDFGLFWFTNPNNN